MALKSVKQSTEKKATPRRASASAASAPKPAQAVPVRTSVKYSSDEDRNKVLKERFCPEGIQYLKDVLGLDLTSRDIPVAELYNIAGGRVTAPLETVVKPLAYDKTQKKVVEMPPIKIVSSFLIKMPFDKETGKWIAPTAEHRPFISSYPCFDYLQKADPSERMSVVASVEAPKNEELPKFNAAQTQALEGIGINEDRLFSNSFNAIPVSVKREMLAGEPFEVNGTVRIPDNTPDSRLSININGMGKMITAKDGTVTVKFDAQYPVEQKSNQIVDIKKVSRIGNLELDFFEKVEYVGTDGKTHRKNKTDVYGNEILNKAGKDLLRYGQAFGPVDGYVHEKFYDQQSHKQEDTVRKEKYQVSLVNGGLCVTKMIKVADLDKDGQQMKTRIDGKEVDKFHYEVKESHVSKNGTVRIGNQDLAPATPKDLEDYKRGFGGRFNGFEYVDMTGKQKKTVTYDVFAVPDNRRSGFSKTFSQKVSEELINRREETTKKPTRKQNFSLGF